MAITRWDPFSELVSLREAMSRLFEESFVRPSLVAPEIPAGRMVPIDVYETDNEIVVKAPLPGAKPEDVDVTVTDDVLTIKGEVKEEAEVKRENYFRQERRFGTYYRQVTLPLPVEADKAQATFENGVLTLTIPKAEKVKPKIIKVTAKSQK